MTPQSVSLATTSQAANPLIQKLGRFVPLVEAERDALWHLSRNAKIYARGTELIAEGDQPISIYLILEGWALSLIHI